MYFRQFGIDYGSLRVQPTEMERTTRHLRLQRRIFYGQITYTLSLKFIQFSNGSINNDWATFACLNDSGRFT